MSLPLYIVFDGCRLEKNLDEAFTKSSNHQSLYRGTSQEILGPLAPHLFPFSATEELPAWYLQNGWGLSWGFIMQTQYTFDELYKHFRKFMMVKTSEGKELYFRFYDPRVMRVFLPVATPQQLVDFFGHIRTFIVEDEDPTFALEYTLHNQALHTIRVPVAQVVAALLPGVSLNTPVQEGTKPETAPTLVNGDQTVEKTGDQSQQKDSSDVHQEHHHKHKFF